MLDILYNIAHNFWTRKQGTFLLLLCSCSRIFHTQPPGTVTSLLPLVTLPETMQFNPVLSNKKFNLKWHHQELQSHHTFQTKSFVISIACIGVCPPPLEPPFPAESIGTRPAPEPPPGYSCATSMLKVSLSSPHPHLLQF
jgi:hypothetical protein